MNRARALSTIGAAALFGTGSGAALAADIPLRLASIPIDGGAQCWYAQNLGYFAAAGIAPAIDSITNGSAITAGVIGGTLDVGYSALMTLAVAHDKGVPLTIIAAAGNYLTSAPISALLVAADSPVKTARDLNGKTVAVNGLKNITQLATMAWTDANGGDSRSLNFIEMGFAEMPAALAAHRVDAAFITEPLVSSAVRRNLGRVIGKPYDAIAPQFTISGWFTLTSWAKANPVLVRKVGGIMRQTSAWANTHDAESAQMLATLTKLPLDVVGTMTRSRFAESMSPKAFQPIIDTAARYGYISKSFPASDMIDPSAV
jgi:NitT/TauT family transport system substrate-binding protein